MEQLNVETEGIKYAGSKRLIIQYILSVAKKLGAKRVMDGFSGTTRVSQAFAKSNFLVLANDISDWSYVFGQCYLQNSRPASYYQPMIEHLNALPPCDGWFTENYGGCGKHEMSDASDGKKKVWQFHNTRKLDAIRPEIDRLGLPQTEKSVLLTSLISAMDRVDSTVGHHASYLRKWAPRSYNVMEMRVPAIFPNQPQENRVTKLDIFEALKSGEADLAYFDPPYGSANEKMPPSRVRYASYYHLWTTIIRNDRPKLVGAANRRQDVSDKVIGSLFEDFRKSGSGRFVAVEAIERMIKEAQAEHIVLSYNNQGRATFDELIEVCKSQSTDLAVIDRAHNSNVMRSMRWTNRWVDENEQKTKELLFVLSRGSRLPNLS